MSDEDIQYRTRFNIVADVEEDTKFTVDEDEQSTLRRVQKALKESLDGLDKWHAFGLKTETELAIKQQIKAHQMAYDIVYPAYDAVTAALATIDERYKRRNQK